MRKKIFILIILLFVVGASGRSPVRAGELNLPVREYTLPNGLRLLVLEKHDAPVFAAQILFKVGSTDDPVGITGVAHMLEHMMFKGTKIIGTTDYEKEVPIMREISKLMDEVEKEKAKGIADPTLINWEKIKKLNDKIADLEKEQSKYAIGYEIVSIYDKFGGVGTNAGTWYDMTDYEVSLPSNKLELWAYLESDRIKNPVFRLFSAERDTIMEERRLAVEDNPSRKLKEGFFSVMFESSPYQRSVIGWPTDIENYTPNDVMDIFKKNYSPRNMVIVIVGDVKPDAVYKTVQKYFGNLQNYGKSRPVFTREMPQAGQKRVEVKQDANPIIMIGFHGPKPFEKERYALDLIAQIMSSGNTSRLYKQLVENKKLVSDIVFDFYELKREFPILIMAEPLENTDLKLLEEEIFKETEKLKKEKVSEWELQKAKNKLIAQFVRKIESNEDLAYELVYYEGVMGSYRLFDLRMPCEAITAEDIQKAAQKYLNKDNSTVGILGR